MSKIRPYTEDDFSAFHLCAVRKKSEDGKDERKDRYTITGCDESSVQISKPQWISYGFLLMYYEFLDGSPCGIEEDEE